MASNENNEMCENCRKLSEELKDKNNQLTIFKKNILELKSHLFESSNLISAYTQTKAQNETLMKENEMFRRKKDDSIDKYQFEILKQKLLNLTQQHNELKLAYNQVSSLLDQVQKEKVDTNQTTRENKLKRELSEKDKYINSQNLIIEKLKNEKDKMQLEKSRFIEEKDRSFSEVDEKDKVKLNELVNEKDFLEDKYKKYRTKYFKYKLKYHELQSNVKFFMSFCNFNANYDNDDRSHLSDREESHFIKKKRTRGEQEDEQPKSAEEHQKKLSFDLSHIKPDDVFEKRPEDDFDCDYIDLNETNKEEVKVQEEEPKEKEKEIPIVEEEIQKTPKRIRKKQTEKTKEIKEKTTGVRTRKMEKEEKKDKTSSEKKTHEKKEEPITDKSKISATEEKNKTKPKKKEAIKLKKGEEVHEVQNNKSKSEVVSLKKEQSTEKLENNAKSKEQKLKLSQDAVEVQPPKPAPKQYIGPIKKPKPLTEEQKKEMVAPGILRILTASNEITSESLKELFSPLEYPTEKVSVLLETIIKNISKLDLPKVLKFLKVFIKSIPVSEAKVYQNNFLEFLNLHINSLSNNKLKFKVSSSNEDYDKKILKENSLGSNLIGYMIDIIYRELDDISPLAKFIYNLSTSRTNSKESFQILKFLNKSFNTELNKNLYDEKTLTDFYSPKNSNSFYFFSSYKSSLISKNMLSIILKIYSTNDKEEVDRVIIESLTSMISKIPNDIILSVDKKDKIKLNTDINYLEIFQLLILISEIRDSTWICSNIFVKIFWQEFINNKYSSMKRACAVYYTSTILFFSLKKENLNPKSEMKRVLLWLQGIYYPNQGAEQISFYDKISALSWVVDSIITRCEAPLQTLKIAVPEIIKKYSLENLPVDFINILKRNKFI